MQAEAAQTSMHGWKQAGRLGGPAGNCCRTMPLLPCSWVAIEVICQKYPQYCWEFHDNSSERPSPEPLLKKEASPAVLGGGERILESLWKPQMPWIIGLGASQPYSRGKFQETLWERFWGLSGIFPAFLPESPSRTGGMAQLEPQKVIWLSAPKSQRFLRFAIAMPIADPRNRAISETRDSNAALRFKAAMESRQRSAISGCDFWAQNPFFLRDTWRFGSVNTEIASDCDCAILVR